MPRSAFSVSSLIAALVGLTAFALQPVDAQQELVYGSQVPAADYLDNHALPAGFRLDPPKL